MRSTRCPACSELFHVPGASLDNELVCPNCGCRIRQAPAAVARPEDRPADAEDSSTADRVYGDVEAERYARQLRRRTLALAIGLMGMLATAVVLTVVVAWPQPGASSRAMARAADEARPVRAGAGDKIPPPPAPRVDREDDDPRAEAEREAVGVPHDPLERQPENVARIPPRGDDPAPKPTAVPPLRVNDPPAMPAAVKPPQPENKPTAADPETRKAKEVALQTRLIAKAPAAEVVKAAEELAVGLEGKEAASRILCKHLSKSQIPGPGVNAVFEALRKVNPKLGDPVQALLTAKAYDDVIDAVQVIGKLSADDAPAAAVDLLMHYKSQTLPDRRKSHAKVDYASDPNAGVVVDAVWSAGRGSSAERAALKSFFKRCLADVNPSAREAAVRCYAETDVSGDTVPELLECLRREKLRGSEERDVAKVKRSDQLRVTIIRTLAAKGTGKVKTVRPVLEILAKRESSDEVRKEAAKAVEQLKAAG
jgi:transcription initiation factor TFIIIB Brf1 subunit/transcription initiation factor TFIIB